jgi:hypothetical protein
MKTLMFVTVMFLGGAGFAAAQMTTSSTDVLGAHLNYGRGCTACHSPHSGAYGNGNAKSSNPNSAVGRRRKQPLWQDDHNGRRQLHRGIANEPVGYDT